MTVIHDREEGHKIGVENGETADVFSGFTKQLPAKIAAEIEAVAMDRGPSYQKLAGDRLPNADIVFDCAHVMQN